MWERLAVESSKIRKGVSLAAFVLVVIGFIAWSNSPSPRLLLGLSLAILPLMFFALFLKGSVLKLFGAHLPWVFIATVFLCLATTLTGFVVSYDAIISVTKSDNEQEIDKLAKDVHSVMLKFERVEDDPSSCAGIARDSIINARLLAGIADTDTRMGHEIRREFETCNSLFMAAFCDDSGRNQIDHALEAMSHCDEGLRIAERAMKGELDEESGGVGYEAKLRDYIIRDETHDNLNAYKALITGVLAICDPSKRVAAAKAVEALPMHLRRELGFSNTHIVFCWVDDSCKSSQYWQRRAFDANAFCSETAEV